MRSPVRRFAPVLAILATLVLVMPAAAGISWCRADPIVRLEGVRVQILIDIPIEYEKLVTGPTHVEIDTSRSINRRLLATDSGFNGWGETVEFGDLGRSFRKERYFWARIRVHIPINTTDTIPVRVHVIPDTGPAATFMVNQFGNDIAHRIMLS